MSIDLDADREQKPEPKPSRPPRRDTRSRASHAKGAGLETRLRESLEAIGDWIRARGDDELGGVLTRDAPVQAKVLTKLANTNPVAKTVVTLVADLLEPVRAFAPSVQIVWRRFLERRAARYAEPEYPEGDEFVTAPVHVGGPELVDEEPPPAEPWRLAE